MTPSHQKFIRRMWATDNARKGGDRRDRLLQKVAFAQDVAAATENGRVAVVWGGMDCDCCAYDGRTVVLRASLVAVAAFVDQLYADAEGPIHWGLIKPSKAKDVQYSSRDLALEAFEDGHPHVVYA